MSKKEFRRVWLAGSAIYTAGMISLITVIGVLSISINSEGCLILLIPILIVSDAILRGIIENMFL